MTKGLPTSGLQKYLSLPHLLLLAIAVAVLLRVVNLGSREFWYDEVLTLLLSTGQGDAYETPKTVVALSDYTALLRIPAEAGIADVLKTVERLIRNLLGGEPHPPLLFLSQHLWLRLFGSGEAATRSLGALLSVGAIAASYGLGRHLLGHRAGLLLAALLGTNPFYLFHSLNVRMYGSLVLWTVLSGWAMLELTEPSSQPRTSRHSLLWSGVLILSISTGLMTFYLFAYWVMALGVGVLYRDRAHWWQQGLRLGAGVSLALPWFFWGTLKQLRNADINRFGKGNRLQHLLDLAQTLGTHLLLGDWVTSLPPVAVQVAGLGIGIGLVGCLVYLWRQAKRPILIVVLLMGGFPLLLALSTDILGGKFTLGFGWGRTLIFALPGLLLLLVLVIEQAPARLRSFLAGGLVMVYLSLSMGDFSLRSRQVFHAIADLAQTDATPTLIVMNSRAWGHVMRLAYYIPADAPVRLLAAPANELAETLQQALIADQSPQVLWLDSARPVWSPASTDIERQQVEEVLTPTFQLVKTRQLTGTMQLDQFTAQLYRRSTKS